MANIVLTSPRTTDSLGVRVAWNNKLNVKILSDDNVVLFKSVI